MPGTRVAPTVDGSPTAVDASFHFIDADNTKSSVNILVDPAVADADIETLAAAFQAGSNASLWKVERQEVYTGVPLASNALSDDIVSVADGVRLQTKQLTTNAYNPAYLLAPLGDMILPGPLVDTTNAQYVAWRNAVQAVLPTGFALLNVAFTQNVQRNQSISPGT